ncbi:hypothetical protein GVN24_33080 [Rhizobium sp. CRIBSB]|nr:hypothetical protein [Rhizobium sp. CRIBSB]
MSEFDHAAFQFGMAVLDRDWPREVFQNLDAVTTALAGKFKGSDTLPRAFLHSFQTVVKQATNQLLYLRDRRDEAAAGINRLTYTFDLIIAGESHGDRQPGVPRIV